MKRGVVISAFLFLVAIIFFFGIWIGLTGKATSEYRGDVNGDGNVDVRDVEFLINYLYVNGPAPNPLDLGDMNDDGEITIADISFLSSYINQNCSNISFIGKYPLVTGDVNKDGVLSQADIDFLSDYLFGSKSNPPQPLALGDVSGDGSISILDVTLLTDYINIRNCPPVTPKPLIGTLLQRGDVTKDGVIDQTDFTFLYNYLFIDPAIAPNPLLLGDTNNDSTVSIGDITILTDYINIRNCSGMIPFGDFSIKLGDVNKNGEVEPSDIDIIINYLFVDGPAPVPLELADVNADGGVSIADPQLLFSYVYPEDCSPIFYDDEGNPIVRTGDGSSSSSPNPVIFSPKNKTYSTRTIALEVGDTRSRAKYWRYSLNGGAKTNFVPNATILAQVGSNTLSVFASRYSSFSSEVERKVSFNVIFPNMNFYCGDNVCDDNEACETCETDCGVCSTPEPSYCGDGTCDFDEDATNCADDCGLLTTKDYSWLFYVVAGILFLLIALVSVLIIQRIKIMRGEDFLPPENQEGSQIGGGPRPKFFPPISSPPNKITQFSQRPMNSYSS